MMNWLKPYWLTLVKWVLIALAILAAWAKGRSEGKTAEKTERMSKDVEHAKEIRRQDAIVQHGSADVDGMRQKLSVALRRKRDS